MSREKARTPLRLRAAIAARGLVALALGVTAAALLLARREPAPEPRSPMPLPPAPIAAAAEEEVEKVPCVTLTHERPGDAPAPGPLWRVVTPDGSPASGARLTLFDPERPGRDRVTRIADAEGGFSWTERRRWIAAFEPGAGFAIADPVAAGDVERVIVLAPGATLRGVVLDARSEPVAGARVAVRFEPPLRPFRADATSDAAGRFEIAGLPGGTALVAARHPRPESPLAVGADGSPRVFIAPSGSTEVLLRFAAPGRVVRPRSAKPAAGASSERPPNDPQPAPTASVSGIARDESGTPVAGVRVALENEFAGVWSETVTDAAGRFLFRTPPLSVMGPTRIAALGAAFDGGIEESALASGAMLVLPLAGLGALRGASSGWETLRADEDVVLLVEDVGTGESMRLVVPRGPFLAAGLRPGRYDVSLLARGRVVSHAPDVLVERWRETDIGTLVAEGIPAPEEESLLPSAEEVPFSAD